MAVPGAMRLGEELGMLVGVPRRVVQAIHGLLLVLESHMAMQASHRHLGLVVDGAVILSTSIASKMMTSILHWEGLAEAGSA